MLSRSSELRARHGGIRGDYLTICTSCKMEVFRSAKKSSGVRAAENRLITREGTVPVPARDPPLAPGMALQFLSGTSILVVFLLEDYHAWGNATAGASERATGM